MAGVAPLAGAWIETVANQKAGLAMTSRPSRARGLKLDEQIEEEEDETVAPLAGAWIETSFAVWHA